MLGVVILLMKTTTTSLCLALSLALGFSTPALADRYAYRDDFGRQRGYDANAERHHHRWRHERNDRWVAPLAILALTGIAVGIAASTQGPPPRPVYVEPPPPPPPVYAPAYGAVYAPAPVYAAPPRPPRYAPPVVVYPPPPGTYRVY